MWKTIKTLSVAALFLFATACDQKSVKNSQGTTQTPTADESLPVDSTSAGVITYVKFTGAWFTVEIPANFSVTHSLQSATRSEGYDSAVFTSPDGKVQFYIFSPQWSGIATDISLQPGETQTESVKATENGLVVERWTIKADNGAYFRSYESTSETGGINKIFGIRYTSQEELERYRPVYLHFKNSLQQYAD